MEKLVFIDETGVKTNMDRFYGRSLKGKRVKGTIPYRHWKSLTFVAALRRGSIEAARLLEGAMRGDSFISYVKDFLVPCLSLGDIVIWDNLQVHKMVAAREAIEAVGARVLFLPPYSPDYNPIEQLFSKLKQLLRGARKRCRMAIELAIIRIVRSVAPKECSNYFENCGYSQNAPKLEPL